MGILVTLGIIFLIVLLFTGLYNKIIRLRNRRENAFHDIDVQLRQRHDLIPQLVETVKGYAKHEREVLQKVTEARAAAMGAGTIDQKIEAEVKLSSALQGLRVQLEAYPDLKANRNFLQFQEELSDIENKLAAARRFFNAATTEYNTGIETFPSNIIAGIFMFKREPLFDPGEEQREKMEEPPAINFDI
ncbi:MAG: LemA family protein [Bacteroidales bacterium]|nr:LemA family protein [Bacteroidales bacterium]